ncbi:MAG: pilus assembly protein TadG-related protein [Gemmatimonadota bacterium]
MMDLARHVLKSLQRRWEDQRGAAMVLVAGSMIALISAVALAVDVGMLNVARTEAQQVADGAALAGAGALILSPDNVDFATAEAIKFSSKNDIQGARAVVRPEDITVDTDLDQVTVRVLRTQERGNPVGTFFARIFGVNTVNITASATAEASPAAGINCLLPLAIPDRWFEASGPGNDPDDFNPEAGDTYVPWMDTSTNPASFNDSYTGYSTADIGRQIILKSNSANGGLNPSWYYPWRPPGQAGGSDYRTNINSCVDPTITFSVGMEVDAEPGNMVGPTKQGFQDLIGLDPHAVWNSNMQCVTDAVDILSSAGSACRSSWRIRPVPMFDPTESPLNGAHPFKFTNFAGIFIEGIQGNDVMARWIGYTALKPASPDQTTAGPQFKVLRLVK